MDSASLAKSGHCPLCASYFVGLKKHYNSCKLKVSSNCSSKFKCEFCSSKFKSLDSKFYANHLNRFHSNLAIVQDEFVELIGDGFFATSNLDEELEVLETNCDAGNEDWLDNLVAVTLASKFSMLHININSLLGPAKFAAARSVLDSKKFDLICLQETKIGSDTPNSLLEATGYSMIRRDRLSGSDGILIYIKTAHKIIHSQIDPQFETITFSLLLGHKHINFISSYNPHFEFAAGHLAHLEHLIKRLGVGPIVLVGDLNQDLNSSRGAKLHELMANYNFGTTLAHPTHYQRNAATLIDVLFCNEPRLVIDSRSVACPFSNHCFVVGTLNINVSTTGGAFLEARVLSQINLDKMKRCLGQVSFDLVDSAPSVEEKWMVLKKLLLGVVDTCAPVKRLRLKSNHGLPWVDKECLYNLHKRNRLHSKALASRSSRESPEWQAFRSARNHCKALLRSKMVAFFADKDRSYFKSSKSFWAFYKRVLKTKKDTSVGIQTIRSATGEPISEELAIASEFNNHLAGLGNSASLDDHQSIDYINRRFREMKRTGQLRVNEGFSISAVEPGEVAGLFRRLDSTSSAGITNIPVKFLIHCADELDAVIAKFFNSCISAGAMPLEWKRAIVTPLFKGKGE